MLIEFEKLDWIQAGSGAKYKEYVNGTQKIRLLEFIEGFVEEDWCIKGHVGYVVEGEMKIDFNGQIVNYSKGDGLWISAGTEQQHKVLIDQGGRVLLVLFEEC